VNLSHEAVKEAVYGAVADLNESLSPDRRVALDGTIAIFGELDSLAAVNLLLRIEERVSDLAGAPCDLMDGDLYEKTVLRSPTLDELVSGVHAVLSGPA
jgi:hypothetical protein